MKRLCETFSGKVYLTSRDIVTGETAIESLQELGYNPAYHQLDVEDQASVDEFQKYIAKNYGGVDVLVNNAGVKCPLFIKYTYLFSNIHFIIIGEGQGIIWYASYG